MHDTTHLELSRRTDHIAIAALDNLFEMFPLFN